ncbi:hypothetical protein AN958_02560 [Leucoagaricus sp. SymC.cos]|nr:hypothetical protein AN958_02560 [Leucoagaricus sp. SymC.cos]
MSGAAPRFRIVDLPRIGIDRSFEIITGTQEIYPPSLIFERSNSLERRIDEALEYRETQRGVVMPVAVREPIALSAAWGSSAVRAVDASPFLLTYPQTESPATSPPITMMIIQTPPWSRNITIFPKPNFDYVTSGDVQREVIKWIKEISDSPHLRDGRAGLSGMEHLFLPDGREIDIELWQWKGLKRHGLESDVWDLHL